MPDPQTAHRRDVWLLRVSGAVLLLSIAALGVASPWLAPVDPFAIAGPPLQPPGIAHPFGTDDLGRDIWSGVTHGALNALLVGGSAAALSGILGLTVGGLAAVRGGPVDHLLMRAADFVQALPRFFLAIAVLTLFGSDLGLVILVLGLSAWPSTARVFRAHALTTLGRDFVAAARASGAGDLRVLVRHVLPVTGGVVAAQVAFQAGSAMLAEAGLSFLGLGDPEVMSWGTLLGSAQHFVRDAWWMSVFPGLAVCVAVLACNLLAEAIAARE